MPAFIFLGAPPDVTETVAYGFRFVVGVPVEVTGELAIRKLTGHRHFEEVKAGVPSGAVEAAPELHTVVKRRGRPPRI
jgi:hypothetical protein